MKVWYANIMTIIFYQRITLPGSFILKQSTYVYRPVHLASKHRGGIANALNIGLNFS